MSIVLFIAELAYLFLLSKRIHNSLFYLFYKVTRSKKTAIYLLAFVFFPGTVIHELAHLFMALLLQVPTGNIDLFPRLRSPETTAHGGQGVRLGSVEIAKVDLFRRFLIGVAPLLVGLGILLVALSYAKGYISIETLWIYKWYVLLFSYILFVITNTMFSSKRDLEGAVPLIVAGGVITFLLYVWGVRIPVEMIIKIEEVVRVGVVLLIIPVVLNTLLYLAARILHRR